MIKELIKKYEELHAELITEYGTYSNLTNLEGLLLRTEMKRILDFIIDLKKLQ